jgi:DNA-binding protein HU-beta
MNTADIAGVVAAEQGIDKAAAKRVIDATLKAITDAAKKGEEVSLPGFGKFKVANRPAREGRNPGPSRSPLRTRFRSPRRRRSRTL